MQQERLPNHRSYLQKSDKRQESCKPFEFPLYAEILTALLASLIASWGGWLCGGENRVWGGCLIILGLCLTASTLTTVGFADPLFWRVGGNLLTGREADRHECQQTEYHQTSQHDGENVSQKLLGVRYPSAITFSEMNRQGYIWRSKHSLGRFGGTGSRL